MKCATFAILTNSSLLWWRKQKMISTWFGKAGFGTLNRGIVKAWTPSAEEVYNVFMPYASPQAPVDRADVSQGPLLGSNH
jgi:hypothetical protein